MSAEVVVVGSCNVDLVMRVPRLPAPGETVTGGVLTRSFGGKGANVAVAAARLGARVALVGAVGTDEGGAAVRADLRGAGVDVRALVDVEAPTGVAHIAVDDGAENTIAVASGANALLSAPMVGAALARVAGRESIVVANLEVPDEAVLAAAEWCASSGCRLVVDPAPARPLEDAILAHCSLLSPNRGELVALGLSMAELLARGVDHVVVTLGANGAELHGAGEAVRPIAAVRTRAVDTTGAGDAFLAGLVVAWQAGVPLPEAVRHGTATGALATRGLGARGSLPTRRDVDALLAA